MKRALCLLICATAALGGCGGDDGDPRGDASKDAEKTVREYLSALLDKDGAAACGKFTPEYQRSVLEQNKSFAEENRARSCPELIEAITRSSPRVTFEDEPLTKGNVGKVELQATARQSGEEWNATVTGRRGVQRYELETRDGRWLITKIARTG